MCYILSEWKMGEGRSRKFSGRNNPEIKERDFV
jgi:hypothetical protein